MPDEARQPKKRQRPWGRKARNREEEPWLPEGAGPPPERGAAQPPAQGPRTEEWVAVPPGAEAAPSRPAAPKPPGQRRPDPAGRGAEKASEVKQPGQAKAATGERQPAREPAMRRELQALREQLEALAVKVDRSSSTASQISERVDAEIAPRVEELSGLRKQLEALVAKVDRSSSTASQISERVDTEIAPRVEELSGLRDQAKELGGVRATAAGAERQAKQVAESGKELREQLEGLVEKVDQGSSTAGRLSTRVETEISPRLEELSELPARVGEVEERVRLVEQRVARAARTVRGLAGRAGAEDATGQGTRRRTTASARQPRAEAQNDHSVDINAADFTQLRELGLSVTESAHLLAVRDIRGGFSSLDEIKELPQLPPEVAGELEQRITVSGK